MVYKVQDGIEFATKAEWRKYMVDTYYSIKNKSNEKQPIVKYPNSINGQSFDIANCDSCRIVIMDHCEQIQIDNLQNCQVFIGASASAIFIRKCEDCTFYCCSKQLRLRECFNSAFYVFTMSEVHIELSKNVVFAPFAGGYIEHKQHLDAAGLKIDNNLWFQVYDHSDADKVLNNWFLLPVHDRSSAWFPDGSTCTCFGESSEIPEIRKTNSIKIDGQVGESFGIEQIISDSMKATSSQRRLIEEENPKLLQKASIDFDNLPLRSAGDGVKQLGIEVALLIAAATAKGIDVSIWLTDMPGVTIVPASEFNTKLTSLGLAVGIHESWEAKRELDLATSKTSLKTIFSLCGHFSSELSLPMIDVSLFLKLSLERVEEHLKHIHLGIEPDTTSPIKQQVRQSPRKNFSPLKPIGSGQLKSPSPSNEPTFTQPKSDEVSASSSSESSIPDSQRPLAQLDETPVPLPAPPMRQYQISEDDINLHDLRQSRGRSSETRFSGSALQSNMKRSHSKDAVVKSGFFRLTGISSEQFESFIKKTVQQTDLYHLIQIHLGFVKPYSIIQPRGDVIVSRPRSWLSIRDIQTAFLPARLRLTEYHVKMLMSLVIEFAHNAKKISVSTEETANHRVSTESGHIYVSEGPSDGLTHEKLGTESIEPTVQISEFSEASGAVMKNGKLSADWLRHYMVQLRLKRPSMPWLEWLGKKLKNDDIVSDDKPKEFRRALAGKKYNLTRDEINHLLIEYELLPEEMLENEINHRVDLFLLDVHGRMDFQHRLNFKIRMWKKENPGRHSQNIMDDLMSKFTEELRMQRKEELLQSEKDDATITKELFWAFDLTCRESKYTSSLNFGGWLQKHAKTCAEHLNAFKVDFQERMRNSTLRASRKHSFAPLNEIVFYMSNVANALPQIPQISFRKAIIALKRDAEREGVAHGKVITKLVFDKHFETLLLSPHNELQQDPVVRELTVEARKSHEWRIDRDKTTDLATSNSAAKNYWKYTKFNKLFCTDVALALSRSQDFENQKSTQADSEFNNWKVEKTIEDRKKKAEEMEKKLLKEKEEVAKKKAAAKSFKIWERLRKKNLYFSQTERKKKIVPNVIKAIHHQKWSKEVDLMRLRPEITDYDA